MNIEQLNVPLVRVVMIICAVVGVAVPILFSQFKQQHLLEQIAEEQWTITHHYLFERGIREANPGLSVPTTVEVDGLYRQLKRQREKQ